MSDNKVELPKKKKTAKELEAEYLEWANFLYRQYERQQGALQRETKQ